MSRLAVARHGIAFAVLTTLAACTPTAVPSIPASASPTPTIVVSASDAPASSSPTPTEQPTPTATPAPTPEVTPSATPVATATATEGPSPIDLPDGLGAFAWAITTRDVDANGDIMTTHVVIGRLGHPASSTLDIPASQGYVRVVTAGGLVAVISSHDTFAHPEGVDVISVRRATDGSEVRRIEVAGSDGQVLLDPGGRVLYAAVAHLGVGVTIHRYALDGTADTTLLALDSRFAQDGIPTNHFGSVIASDRHLVTFACSDRGCRLWDDAPGKPASQPRILHVPKLCLLVAASPDRLIAYDDATCFVDTGDADLPLRTIDRETDASRLISTAPRIAARRIIRVGGRDVVVVSSRSRDGATTEITTLDIVAGDRQPVVRNLPNDHQDDLGWFEVTGLALPGTWVLVDRVGGASDHWRDGRLIDAATNEVIELPAGLVGWSS